MNGKLWGLGGGHFVIQERVSAVTNTHSAERIGFYKLYVMINSVGLLFIPRGLGPLGVP